HDGGVAGSGRYPRRAGSASAFDGAPRYHGGGIAGLLPNEVPAILERGERVIPKGQGGGSNVSVSMPLSINAAGADPAALQRAVAEFEGFRASIEKTVVSTVRNAIQRGYV